MRSIYSDNHLSSTMAHNTSPANLSNSHDPAFHPSRTNAIPSRHTIPATPHSPHYQATRSPIRHDHTPRNPIHYNNATRHTTTGMAHDMTSRQAARMAGRNLFFYGRADGMPPLPHDARLAQLQMRKTPLPRKTPLLCSVASPQKNSLFPSFCPMQLR